MSAVLLKNVFGDLYAGDARLFFKHPRYASCRPYRVDTASDPGDTNGISFSVRIFSPDMIVLCDSRMNSARVVQKLESSDIGSTADAGIYAYDPANAGRWTNLRETSDARHWSEGETRLSSKRVDHEKIEHIPKKVSRVEANVLSGLLLQLPPVLAEAIHDGRGIIISRKESILNNVWCDKTYELRVIRVLRAFKTDVYALCCEPICKDENGPGRRVEFEGKDDVVALLFVGALWQKNSPTTPAENGVKRADGPVLTVARRKRTRGVGGRVFCICLGNRLTTLLDGLDVEKIATSKRHYEGYLTDAEFYDLFAITTTYPEKTTHSV